jgi:hypothetical protein
VDLGRFAPGDMLVLGIKVRDTGETFYAGPPSWNPDEEIHSAITYLGDCSWRIGFEDLYGGGDQDFDDILMVLSGPLEMRL